MQFTAESVPALSASPIPEIARSAEAYERALRDYRAAGADRARFAQTLQNADHDDAVALERALTAGRPAPAPIDRDMLEVQRAEAAAREAATYRIAQRAFHAAIAVALDHAEAWSEALDSEHEAARSDLADALNSVRAATQRLDEIDGASAAAHHLLTSPHDLRGKFLRGGVRFGSHLTYQDRVTTADELLDGLSRYQQRSPGQKIADQRTEQGRPRALASPVSRAFEGGDRWPDARVGGSLGGLVRGW
ncbi:hypothetical protein ACUN7V_02405 [Quadrisphaera oryzae]